jgi:hypothetical protein
MFWVVVGVLNLVRTKILPGKMMSPWLAHEVCMMSARKYYEVGEAKFP